MKSFFSWNPVGARAVAKVSNRIGLVGRLGYFSPHTTFYAPISFAVPQASEFSPDISDHLLGEYTTSKSMTWNGMMQAKGNNTGFPNFIEDFDAYRRRTITKLNLLARFLDEHPDMAVICLQESEINEHRDFVRGYINAYFPPEWKLTNSAVMEDATDWGVLTLINHERLNTSKPMLDLSLTRNIPIKDIQIRCRTFVMFSLENLQAIKWTNLHLPHNDTEVAFSAFMDNVIADIIQHGVHAESLTHHLLGDWNIDAERLNMLTQQKIAEHLNAAPVGTIFPFNISVNLYSSKEGHLKQSGQKLSVDSLLSIAIEPSESYQYTFHHFHASKSTIVAAALFTSSIFINTVAFDEAPKLAQNHDSLRP